MTHPPRLPATDDATDAAATSVGADALPAEVDDAEVEVLAVFGDAPVAANPKRWWVLPLRIVLSVAMLAFLVTKIPDFDPAEAVPDWGPTNTAWLAAALALTLGGVVLSAVRWQTVLRALGLHERLRPLLGHYFAGQFVSNVLPTTIGGDVLRVSRLARENGDAPDTFASVVLERLTGWIVLPLITLVGLGLNPGLRRLGEASSLAALTAVATLVALAGLLVLADHPRLGGRFGDTDGWRRFAAAVHLGIGRLRQHPTAAVEVLAVGLVYQFVLVLAAVAAARALDIEQAGITALAAFYPAVLIVQVLPIGISGLGVREGAFVLFLGPLGVPDEQAVALGLLLYVLNLAASLAGAPAFAAGGRTGEPPEP